MREDPALPPWINPPLPPLPERPVFRAPPRMAAPERPPSPRTCQWLEGDARLLDWCGKAVAKPGQSWCKEHERLVYPRGRH